MLRCSCGPGELNDFENSDQVTNGTDYFPNHVSYGLEVLHQRKLKYFDLNVEIFHVNTKTIVANMIKQKVD